MNPVNVISRWCTQLRGAHSDHHAIARGMAWVTLFVLFGSLAKAAKEMAIAYRYGLSADVDAYLFVFNLVNWPVAVWFSVLTVVLVPLAARVRQDSAGELPRFRSELLGLTLIVAVALALSGRLGLEWILRSPIVGLPAATAEMAIQMAPTLTLLAPSGAVIGLFSAWILAGGRHANTLMESLPSIVILLALLFVSVDGIEPLLWGTVAGFGLHLASLLGFLHRRNEFETPRVAFRSPYWKPFLQGFGIMLGGQLLMNLAGIVDQFFAANMGTGTIAALNYANRILTLVLGLGAVAVSRATLPVFSDAETRGADHVVHVARRWVKILFVLGVVAMVISWLFAPWIVKLLFERGAFVPENTAVVAEIMRYGLPQLPFFFASIVFVSLLSSQRKFRAIAVVAATNLTLKLIALGILVPFFGINGIMLSTAVMYAGSLIMLIFSFKGKRK